ncbi:hypothetical protein AURDEDRAFT_117045 [Auricularia subglabra TFB-10046 SS5]|nr:hypothetical protein AURDEDRAFT_117045 [Auricularia subglabra TFB-10046 SS5]
MHPTLRLHFRVGPSGFVHAISASGLVDDHQPASSDLLGMSAGPSRAPSSASSLSPISPLPSPLARPLALPTTNGAPRPHWESVPLPPPGPEHFEARRAAWLAVPEGRGGPRTAGPGWTGKELLNGVRPGEAVADDVWRALRGAHTSLLAGSRLKVPMPMADVVKLLHLGWQRDGTWPPGAQVQWDS